MLPVEGQTRGDSVQLDREDPEDIPKGCLVSDVSIVSVEWTLHPPQAINNKKLVLAHTLMYHELIIPRILGS